MKRWMLAEAAFQIGLYLLIAGIGFGIGELLAPLLGSTWARLIGGAVTTALAIKILFNWSCILERFWPRPTE